MSKNNIIGHSARRNTHGHALQDIKAAVNQHQTTASFESSFGAGGDERSQRDALDAAIAALAPVLEKDPSASFESAKNKTGLEMAGYILALGDQSSEYMESYSKESAAPKGSLGATTLNQSYDSVYSTESFDNQVLDKYRGLSIAVNYSLGKQGPSMEAMYRTVPVTPDTAGIEVDFANLLVQNILERDLSGNPQDFGYRRLVDAYIDSKLLSDDAVRILPLYSTETAHNFVEDALSAPHERTIGNRTVLTNFLKVQHATDLIAIGHLDKASRSGVPNFTDALDRSLGIELLLHEIAGTAVQWDVLNQPGSRFVPASEGNVKRLILDHQLGTLTLDKDSVGRDGTALTGAGMDLIRDRNLRVRMRLTINGDTNVEGGGTTINPGNVQVSAIFDANGKALTFRGPGADASLAPILEMVQASKIVGYFPDSRLTNSNNRHLGMMLAHRANREILVTKTRAPFFYAYPKNESRDDTAANHLSVAVAAYTHTEGLKHMVGVHDRIMKQTGGLKGELTEGNFENNLLMIEGIARNITNPYVQTVEVDLTQFQSMQTLDNIANAQEVLFNLIRKEAFDIRQHSGYEAACRMIGGNDKVDYKFTLVTTERVNSLLHVRGDSRTLGAGLEHQIFGDTSDLLFDAENDYIYMGITRDTEGVDILSNGVCLQSPTMVTQVTSWRDGAQAEELMVQPRFNHYQLNTILVKFVVKGVSELLSQLNCFSVDLSKCSEAPVEPGNPGDDTGPVDPGTGGSTGGDDGAGTNP